MRIVGGKRKGLKLYGPGEQAIRPTSDRTREALFNIVTQGRWRDEEAPNLKAARVLDAFAGTGAIGLEAASRGAAEVVFMESQRAHLDLIRKNAQSFSDESRFEFLGVDATQPPTTTRAVDFCFLDPPYGLGLLAPALKALSTRGWIKARTVAFVELGAKEAFTPPQGFSLLDERRYGKTKLLVLRDR